MVKQLEKKGIACSSRNFSLNKNQLMIACDIYKYLVSIKKKIEKIISDYLILRK